MDTDFKECQNGLGCRDLKAHPLPPSAMDRDTFQVLSKLALDTSRGGAATAALGAEVGGGSTVGCAGEAEDVPSRRGVILALTGAFPCPQSSHSSQAEGPVLQWGQLWVGVQQLDRSWNQDGDGARGEFLSPPPSGFAEEVKPFQPRRLLHCSWRDPHLHGYAIELWNHSGWKSSVRSLSTVHPALPRPPLTRVLRCHTQGF